MEDGESRVHPMTLKAELREALTLDRVFTDPDTPLAPTDEWMGAQVLRFPYRGSMRYPLAPAVVGHVRDADVVHVHAIDFFFDYMSFARPLHRRPMVATTHGGIFHSQDQARLKRLWFSTVTRTSARSAGKGKSQKSETPALAPSSPSPPPNGLRRRLLHRPGRAAGLDQRHPGPGANQDRAGARASV